LPPPRSLNGSDVVGIVQEQLLFFELGDELGPPLLDGVVIGLRECGERE
jgi:hypothetical protein